MELVRLTSHRGLSVRSIIGFVLTVVLTAFLLVGFSSHTASAAPEKAEWNNGNLLYNTHAYGKADAEINKKLGLDEGATVYSYIPQDGGGSTGTKAEAFFIYFASGVDPPSATSANFVAYDLGANNTYSNAHDKRTIEVMGDGTQGESYSSCNVSGLGWIICPVSVWLADSMDSILSVIQDKFLSVKPLTLTAGPDNGLYTAWNIMRSIANIAFVIAFIFIIYSQLTGLGINNYGLKKLIPRLIVAAVMVNLSFIVSAAAIDVANIIGYSIQDVFNSIRTDVFQMTNDNSITWGNLATLILAGGGTLFGVGYAVVTGAVFSLVPVLIFVVLTIFTVLIVLAARQAIIILLVIIAPLAFVANLLPNTEDLYKKWQKLFMTMLIFFPAFSAVFGAAQLAGQVIIMNANGSILTTLFGMAVQIAPLAITPLMFKLGGSLLARIGQIANNPNRGPIDRTRKWANRKQGLVRSKTNSQQPQTGWGKVLSAVTGGALARKLDDGVKHDEERTKAYSQISENRRMSHRGGRFDKTHLMQTEADDEKRLIHNQIDEHTEELRSKAGTKLHKLALDIEASTIDLTNAKAKVEGKLALEKATLGAELNVKNLELENTKATTEEFKTAVSRNVEEMRSGRLQPQLTGTLARISQEMRDTSVSTSAEKEGLTSAQYEVSRNISEAMNAEGIAGEALRKIAGGVGGDQAQVRARARAVSNLNKLDNDALSANVELLKANAAQAGMTIKAYSAGLVNAAIDGQTTFEGAALNEEMLHAGLQAQANEKNVALFEKARGSMNVDQSLLSRVIADNNTTFKAAGGFHLQENPNLNIQAFGGDKAKFEKEMAYSRLVSLSNTSAANMAGLKASWVENLGKGGIQESIAAAVEKGDKAALVNAYMATKNALTNEQIRSQIEDREDYIRTIEAELAKAFGEKRTEDPRPDIAI